MSVLHEVILLLGAPALFCGVALSQEQERAGEPQVAPASEEGTLALEAMDVAQGLSVELFAAEPLLANPVAFAIDRQMHFFVAESFRLHHGVTDMREHMDWLDEELACRTVEDRVAMLRRHGGERFAQDYVQAQERVRRIWDEDGDGRAESVTVFADAFDGAAAGIGAGLLCLGNAVYYTCIPKLWRLLDRDGDGVCDERRILLDGFGVHVALLGHDMHGLTRGPDGRLYWSIGDRGFHVEQEGRVFAHPRSGAVLRSELDGSHFEVFATGLRNPQELCFDDHGNLWTGDNNSDAGDRARWTYLLLGAEFGWRHAYQYVTSPNPRGPWMAERVWEPDHEGRPAFALPCVANFADGPSGLAYYPGTGLGPDWRGYFFLCDFRGSRPYSGIQAFRVEPHGAGFTQVDPRHLVWNCLPTDVDFGPDGNLYFTDWVSGWGMTGKGRIYRVSDERYAGERDELATLLGEGMEARENEVLGDLLAHANQRVRLEAQWELARRGARAELTTAALGGEGLARLHGIWGLAEIARKRPELAQACVTPLFPLAEDGDAEVRAQLAWLLGDLRFGPGLEVARELLVDPSPRVAGMAGQALGQMGAEEAREALVEAVARCNDEDPWLRHQLSYALASLGRVEPLAELAADERAAVRRAAVVALRRLGAAEVAAFLADSDPSIVAEAARAIYDRPIDGAMGALADTLSGLGEGDDGYLVRRALAACRRLGGGARARQIAQWLIGGGAPGAAEEALHYLTEWEEPASIDPITGEWRPLARRGSGEVRQAIGLLAAADAARSFDENSLKAWVALLAEHPESAGRLANSPWGLERMAVEQERPWSVRLDALTACIAADREGLSELLERACADGDGRVRALAYRALGEREPQRATALLLRAARTGSPAERGAALVALGAIDHPAAREALEQLSEEVVAGGVNLLELEEARSAQGLSAVDGGELARRVRAQGLEAHYASALAGGDPKKGRHIFLEKVETSCLRCHAFADKGGSEVGPELTHVGARLSRDEILASIVDPNAKVAPEFENWILSLDDGTLVTGRIRSEEGGVVRIETPQKELLELDAAEITGRQRDLSSMPQDIATHLSPRELRDLCAFLAQQR